MSDTEAALKDMNWLVANRSRNQSATIAIYEIYCHYQPVFILDDNMRLAAQRLTMTAFSLWRSVFLSDTENRKDLQVKDAMHFLNNLILHNSVTYNNDQNAKNFSFRYYVRHARDRLEEIAADANPKLLPKELKSSAGLTAQQWWEVNQRDLDKAIKKFRQVLDSLPLEIGKP